MFSSTFAKTIFFITAVEILFLLWLPDARVHNGHVALFVILFILVSCMAAFVGLDFFHSFWSNYERMMGLWTLLHVGLFFVVLSSSIDGERSWVKILQAIVLGAVFSALMALPEIFKSQGAIRIGSTFNNAAFLASYLVPSFFIALWLMARDERFSWRTVVWFSVAILIATVIFFTGTRGALVALAFGGLFLGVLFFIYAPRAGHTISLPHQTLRKIIGIGFVCVSIALVSGIVFRDRLVGSSLDPLSRLASISFSKSAAGGRVEAWSIAREGWRKRLLFGWGPENLNLLFDKYYRPSLVDQEPWFDRAHSFIFDIGGTTGIFGLLAYLGMFVSAWVLLYRGMRQHTISFWAASVFMAALLAHFVQNLFVFDTMSSLVVLFVIFAFVHAVSQKKNLTQPVYKRSLFIVCVGFLVLVPLWYVGVWKPARENYLGKLGYDAFARGDDKSAEQYIERALSYNTYGNINVRQAVAEYAFDFLKKGGRRDAHSLKYILDYAAEKMGENIHEQPQNVKWYMYQGQLYNLAAVLLGAPDVEYAKKAEGVYLKALALSPGRPQIYLEIAQAREVLRDYAGMWDILDRAVVLAPEYDTIHYNLLAHAIAVGDPAREKQEFDIIVQKEKFPSYPLIRDAYMRAGRMQDVIAMQRAYVEDKEREVKVYGLESGEAKNLTLLLRQLAGLYKRVGDKEHARTYAERAREVDPALAKEVEIFLRSL